MANRHDTSTRYEVGFNPFQVKREEVALTRDGDEGFRYFVRLTGNVDYRWRTAFALAQLNETGFFRYRLAETDMLIKFISHSDNAGELRRLLERLQSLLDLANAGASELGPDDPRPIK